MTFSARAHTRSRGRLDFVRRIPLLLDRAAELDAAERPAREGALELHAGASRPPHVSGNDSRLCGPMGFGYATRAPYVTP